MKKGKATEVRIKQLSKTSSLCQKLVQRIQIVIAQLIALYQVKL